METEVLKDPESLLASSHEKEKDEDYRGALNLLQEALQIFQASEDKEGEKKVLLIIGDLYFRIGDYENALLNYFKFLSASKGVEDPSEVLKSYHKIGQVYQTVRDFDPAIEYFSKATILAAQTKDENELALALFALGNVYNWADDFPNSEKYLLQSLNVAESLENERVLIKPVSSLAILYTKMNKLDESLQLFERGIDLANKLNLVQIRVGMLKSLGNLYLSRKEFDLALSTLTTAQKEAEELKMNTVLLLIHGFFADTYEAMGDYKSALVHHKKHLEYEKELMNEEVKLKTKGLQAKFELEEARKENERTKSRNEELEKANEEIHRQKGELEVKNKNITDSIVYAERIQRAMLPEEKQLKNYFPESFILYLPRDIVSGDFFWFQELNGLFIIAVADCTGHGVPGALMSMIGNDLMNHIVIFRKITSPSEIVRQLNKGVRRALKQNENQSRDGMDISICVIDRQNRSIRFAGANNGFWLKQGDLIHAISGTKASVGGHTPDEQVFIETDLDYNPGDCLLMGTDGYADQFGGPLGKKFKHKQLREFLRTADCSMTKLHESLNNLFNDWKGELEQVDDVCVIGIQL